MLIPNYKDYEFFEKMNQGTLNAITADEATCVDFPISCHERYGVYGIWFQDEEDFLLVNPLDLVNSIYMDDTYYSLLEDYNDGTQKGKRGIYKVFVTKQQHCISWGIFHTHSQSVRLMRFTYKEYIGKIQSSIEGLYLVWTDTTPIAYKPLDVEFEGIVMCKKQLSVASVCPSHYQLMADSITPEKFVLRPVEDKYKENYEIGIGDRFYTTVFTHWDNDMEAIRHQLETYVYEREATIKMSFDMSDTIVKLGKRSALSKIKDCGEGYAFDYKDYILVEIIPNEFVHYPIIKGWGNEKEVIRTFYEGLLNMACRLPMEGNENDADDLPSGLVAYNRYKSPVIESFLRGDKDVPNTYMTRQVHVKHIICIDPDYGVYLWDEEDVADSLEGLYDHQGNPISMPEFDEWASEMHSIVVASETGEPYEKDWNDYHKRGLALAHQLRQQLSTDFDLWYEAPFEDKSGVQGRTLII